MDSEDKGFWIARDKCGTPCLFLGEPVLDDSRRGYLSPDDGNSVLLLDESMFPGVTWEKDPIEADLLKHSELESIIMERLRNEMFRK